MPERLRDSSNLASLIAIHNSPAGKKDDLTVFLLAEVWWGRGRGVGFLES